ncbi:MAG: M48 family metallopeptidase [Erysipelotrichaceae bacterium]|nr:M48 family metallopeptidase [Erysipelotrichaceae bacterium]
MQKMLSTIYQNKEYPVIIEHKSMRHKSIRFRLKNGSFMISAPYTVSDKHIMKLLEEKYAPLLIAKEKPPAVGDDFIYLFGSRYSFPSQGQFTFSNGEILSYKDKEEFDKKIRKLYLKIITERVRYYEQLMKTKEHNVRVRKMSTRYGTNSKKTNTVCFALTLYSYSYQIIDAIIVHELAHDYHFDHSPNFYKVVYNFCPNYKELHKKLRKGEFQ